MLDRPGRGDVKCRSAESRSICADDKLDIERCRARSGRPVGDVKDIYPVSWACIIVVKQAPGAVRVRRKVAFPGQPRFEGLFADPAFEVRPAG